MVLEVNLNYFIRKSEHNCVLRAHPLLNVNGACRIQKLICCVQLVPSDELLFLSWVIILLEV